MKPIYTVFTLSHPSTPREMRYVGMTTQTVTKRVGDITAGSMLTGTRMFNSLIGEWIRKVVGDSLTPLATVQYESSSKNKAGQFYRDYLNSLLHTGLLLNSRPGQIAGRVRSEPIADESIGRPVNPDSVNSLVQTKRKRK